MTRDLPLLLLSLAASALMWLTAARGLLPMQAWPAPPFHSPPCALWQVMA